MTPVTNAVARIDSLGMSISVFLFRRAKNTFKSHVCFRLAQRRRYFLMLEDARNGDLLAQCAAAFPAEGPLPLADALAKRFEIQNVDMAVRGNLNHSGAPQPCELARNRSNRQTKKVANFGARKRKIESRNGVATCKRIDLPNHHHKKAGYLFGCRLSSKRQHPLAPLIDLTQGLV